MRKLLLIIGIIAALLIAGYLVFNSDLYKQKQGQTEDTAPHRGTLTGEYICLPPTGELATKTTECINALKTDQGKYYVLDFNLMSQAKPDLKEGDRFTATGVITPIENLSTDYWQKYPTKIEGIFSITDSVQKL